MVELHRANCGADSCARGALRSVWERNSLGIPLWTPKVFEQKLDYIRFYEKNENDWVFLTHHEG